jgi:hypothetical protein
MCPALERYEREAFQELHPFEVIPGTGESMDPSDFPRVFHPLAVKVCFTSFLQTFCRIIVS